MIVLLRVDDKLLHGQIAFSWTKFLEVDCILIANDNIVNDEIKKLSMNMSKPQEIKLVIKDVESSINDINTGKTDKYNLLIIVENIEDAYKLVSNCKIPSINLGGIKVNQGSSNISKTINLTKEDEDMLEELQNKGIEIEIRRVPNEKKIIYKRGIGGEKYLL